ncbi:MAG TPA: TIM barrel protein [Vicinamibacterales bacterium]|nr:TIM barrel protein [Vicinamibacterales bacterium]
MTSQQAELIHQALDDFRIELPSWGFANTGTRFGKFLQAAAAVTIEEKFSDAGQVHALTGACPTLALHVLWDLPRDTDGAAEIRRLSAQYGVAPGSINPNLFEDQRYKFGSFGNPDPLVRAAALRHVADAIALADALDSRDISLWFPDGSNYPGTANIRQRRAWFVEALQASHLRLSPAQRLLVEYKPFEPAFYHSDIADWGMALLLARAAGPRARVLVDTGHHYLSQNIEQIVAWLLADDMLGGFHFNDRKYADDDLTLGSIDPYQVFRIFHEIALFEHETGRRADVAFMIDQSHNLKGKIEATIQTVMTAQELYAKAAIVDRAALLAAQGTSDLMRAEGTLQDAFSTDVRPAIRDWRTSRRLPADPLRAFRESGYLERITAARAAHRPAGTSSYA